MEQYYKIAGLTVKMDTFGRTQAQAQAYRCSPCSDPQIVIKTTPQEIQAKYSMFAEDIGEHMVTGAQFYRQLLDYDGMMLHSSAIVVDGKAYLFTADSGTGKSTHTRLWLQKFGDRAFILNDDKPALRLEDGTWYAYGTPWSGKEDISVDVRVPVAGIAVVYRAQENTIEPFKGIGAIHAILKQVNRPVCKEYREKLLDLLDKLITQVPVWKLQCNMDPEAAEVSYRAMSGKG